MSQCEMDRPSRRWALNSPDTHVILLRGTHTQMSSDRATQPSCQVGCWGGTPLNSRTPPTIQGVENACKEWYQNAASSHGGYAV